MANRNKNTTRLIETFGFSEDSKQPTLNGASIHYTPNEDYSPLHDYMTELYALTGSKDIVSFIKDLGLSADAFSVKFHKVDAVQKMTKILTGKAALGNNFLEFIGDKMENLGVCSLAELREANRVARFQERLDAIEIKPQPKQQVKKDSKTPAKRTIIFESLPHEKTKGSLLYKLIQKHVRNFDVEENYFLEKITTELNIDPWVLQGYMPLPNQKTAESKAHEVTQLLAGPFQNSMNDAEYKDFYNQLYTSAHENFTRNVFDISGALEGGYPKTSQQVLRNIRHSLGLSQDDMDRKLGFSIGSYRGYENAKKPAINIDFLIFGMPEKISQNINTWLQKERFISREQNIRKKSFSEILKPLEEPNNYSWHELAYAARINIQKTGDEIANKLGLSKEYISEYEHNTLPSKKEFFTQYADALELTGILRTFFIGSGEKAFEQNKRTIGQRIIQGKAKAAQDLANSAANTLNDMMENPMDYSIGDIFYAYRKSKAMDIRKSAAIAKTAAEFITMLENNNAVDVSRGPFNKLKFLLPEELQETVEEKYVLLRKEFFHDFFVSDELGKFIKGIRQSLGMSRQEFSGIMGNGTAVFTWEDNQKIPHSAALEKLQTLIPLTDEEKAHFQKLVTQHLNKKSSFQR